MEYIQNGSILTPAGFRAGWSCCGLRTSGKGPDIALLAGDSELSAAGVFTQNLFAAAPVKWCRSILPSGDLRAIAVNSGNANACTGDRGDEAAFKMAECVASLLGCRPNQVAVASTGIIGRPMPMPAVKKGLKDAFETLSAGEEAARGAERAIMTTDTRPKACAVSFTFENSVVSIGGMAKGSGMVAPDLATMLAFITTDISASGRELQEILKECAESTFNRVTIDGDTSTNDSVIITAGGRSGISVGNPVARELFTGALHRLMENLALQIARDGEGATRLIEVRVRGAASDSDAGRAARAVAESLLVKCAVNGQDPNWGRIVCAAGYSGAEFDPRSVSLFLGNTAVVEKGLPTGRDARADLGGDTVNIGLTLGNGAGAAVFWTCDISKKYVEINAEYST